MSLDIKDTKVKSFLKYMSDRLPEIIATNDTGDVDDSTLVRQCSEATSFLIHQARKNYQKKD